MTTTTLFAFDYFFLTEAFKCGRQTDRESRVFKLCLWVRSVQFSMFDDFLWGVCVVTRGIAWLAVSVILGGARGEKIKDKTV